MLRLGCFFCAFIIASFFSHFYATSALAVEEFRTSLRSEYVLDSRGAVTVRNQVTIINNFSALYSSQFAFEVGSGLLKNVRVLDANGRELPANIVQTEKKTSIAIIFSDKIVGKDQSRQLFIEYEHPEVVVNTGSILEIDIPKLAAPDAFQEYVVSVVVPSGYGTPSAASPANYATEAQGASTRYVFRQAVKTGVNLLFGEQQTYRFSLRYNLQNPSVSQGVAQVALPPDTAYQRMRYELIQPRPDRITQDADGNWIATFSLAGEKEQTVQVEGTVMVYLQPKVARTESAPLPEHLRSGKFWPTGDPEIQRLAKELKTPQAIYNYVVAALQYDYGRLRRGEGGRRGAGAVLAQPETSLCQDFTDLFITLSRAAGIPARELTGFAYTNNPRLRPLSLAGDVLHAWPEYYSSEEKRWIPVDPTWGKTTDGVDYFSKLDFYHVVFAVRGVSEETPYPAGMYKLLGQESKDVTIEPVAELVPESLRVQLEKSRRAQDASIMVTNLTGMAWYNVPVEFAVPAGVEVGLLNHQKTIELLPYERKEILLEAIKKDVFSVGSTVGVGVKIGDQEIIYDLATLGNNTQFIALAVGGVILVLAILAGSVLVYRRRR